LLGLVGMDDDLTGGSRSGIRGGQRMNSESGGKNKQSAELFPVHGDPIDWASGLPNARFI
ncbi:MAG TPA: hypothetical protein VNZ22_00860, partial [Bacillota bacterium]|nr:hypothetical protein [Bacillota bacterium]